MDQHKGLIIALVLLLSIFALSLALGFRPKAGDGPKSSGQAQNREAAKYSQDSWLSVMDDMLAPLAPAVRDAEMQASAASCGRGPGSFKLTDTDPCTVTIKPASDKRRTLSLQADKNTAFYIPGDKGELCAGSAAARHIKLRYEMNDADAEPWSEPSCWKPARNQQRYKLPVLSGGGVLTLSCDGCATNDGARLLLE